VRDGSVDRLRVAQLRYVPRVNRAQMITLALCLASCGGPTPAAVEPPPTAPPAARCDAPLGAGDAFSVYGHAVGFKQLRAIYRLLGFDRYSAERADALELARWVVEGAVERELLAHDALARGLALDPGATMARVRERQHVFLSSAASRPEGYPDGALPRDLSRDGAFDEGVLLTLVRDTFAMSMPEVIRWQAREALALERRAQVVAGVTVDDEAVWEAYRTRHDVARVRYVQFAAHAYRSFVPDPGAVARWQAENAEEVARAYELRRHQFLDLPPQRRASHILFRVEEGASDDERASVRRRAERVLRQARRGGADFATLAREHSDDAGSAARGGDLGWFPRGRMVAPFEEAVFDAERPGVVPRLVESRFGLHVVRVAGMREGDVPRAEAERELAESLYVDAESIARARRAAEAVLAAWRGGAPLAAQIEALDADLSPRPRVQTMTVRPEPIAPAPRAEAPPDVAQEAEPAPDVNRLTPAQMQELMRRLRQMQRGRPQIALRRALEMETGEIVAAPVQQGDDWLIFEVVERAVPRRGELTEPERSEIEEELLAAPRRERLAEHVAELRDAAIAAGCLQLPAGVYDAARDQLREPVR